MAELEAEKLRLKIRMKDEEIEYWKSLVESNGWPLGCHDSMSNSSTS